MVGSEVGYQPFAEPGAKGEAPANKLGALDQDDPKLLADKEFNPDAPNTSAPRKGNTVYLNAQGITEAIVRKTCTSHGTIVNVSVEENKSCAFVTFETNESAEKAIQALDGNFLLGITFKAALARRQPQLPTATLPPPPPAANNKDEQRGLVVYDVDLF